MSRRRSAAVVVAALLAASSARNASARTYETASFKTEGGSARVYLDGKYVGDTPLDLEVPCPDVADRSYRLERDGCTPIKGTLNARLGGGRVVGAVFTLGVTLLLKCPTYFVPVRETLDCTDAPRDRPIAVEDLQPRAEVAAQPARAPSSLTEAEINARLRALKNQRERGAISETHYQAQRGRLVRQLDQ